MSKWELQTDIMAGTTHKKSGDIFDEAQLKAAASALGEDEIKAWKRNKTIKPLFGSEEKGDGVKWADRDNYELSGVEASAQVATSIPEWSVPGLVPAFDATFPDGAPEVVDNKNQKETPKQ